MQTSVRAEAALRQGALHGLGRGLARSPLQELRAVVLAVLALLLAAHDDEVCALGFVSAGGPTAPAFWTGSGGKGTEGEEAKGEQGLSAGGAGTMSVVGYLRDVSEPENYFEIYAGRVAVGRAESNDIKLASRSVSSHHAEIEIEPSSRPPKMVVTDLGSRNATFVNEVRLLGSSRAVAWGDVVRFGYDSVTYRLVQELEGPKGKAPADACPPAVRLALRCCAR